MLQPLTETEFDALAQLALSVARAATVMSVEQLDTMLAQIQLADSVGPILDPTLYRKGSQKLDELRALIVATRDYRVALKRIVDNAGT